MTHVAESILADAFPFLSCGMWLTGVGGAATYESTGKSCTSWNDWRSWSPELKANISNFVLAEMDALQNFMFWTWRIGTPQSQSWPSSPFWHYKLGREQGWIPRDPRAHVGMCASLGVGGDKFSGEFPSSAIGKVSCWRLYGRRSNKEFNLNGIDREMASLPRQALPTTRHGHLNRWALHHRLMLLRSCCFPRSRRLENAKLSLSPVNLPA